MLGSPLALLNQDSEVALRYHYDEFGTPEQPEKFDLNYPGPDNLFGYTGLGYDSACGLSYARARYFDSGIGRFVSQDTYEGEISNRQSLNLYVYVSNNPLIYVDLSGHRHEWGAGGGGDTPKSGWQKIGDEAYRIVDLYTMGERSDYVDVSINRPYTVEHFAKAGLLIISVVPITQAEKATLKVAEEGTSLIKKAGKWFLIKVTGKGADDVYKIGKKALNKLELSDIWIKNKHLSGGTGSWAKFNVATEKEATSIVSNAIENGTIKSITDNKGVLGDKGQKTFEIIIDAGKEVGSKGERNIRLIIDELGNLWSVFPD